MPFGKKVKDNENMFLTILDLALILALFIFIALGFSMGLIQAIGAIVGVILGAMIANDYFKDFGNFLTPFFLGNSALALTISFIIIFSIVNRLVGLIFYVVGKFFNLLSIIPFLKTFNRLLGAIFGAIEGCLVLGLLIYFLSGIQFWPWLNSTLAGSVIAPWLIYFAGILMPLIPQVATYLAQIKNNI